MQIVASLSRDSKAVPPPNGEVTSEEGLNASDEFLDALREFGHNVPRSVTNMQAVFEATEVPALTPVQSVAREAALNDGAESDQTHSSLPKSGDQGQTEAHGGGSGEQKEAPQSSVESQQPALDMHSLRKESEGKAQSETERESPEDVSHETVDVASEKQGNELPRADEKLAIEDGVVSEEVVLPEGSDQLPGAESAAAASAPTERAGKPTFAVTKPSEFVESKPVEKPAPKQAEVSALNPSTPVVEEPKSTDLEEEGAALAKALNELSQKLNLTPPPAAAGVTAPPTPEVALARELLLARMWGQLESGAPLRNERLTLSERLQVGASSGPRPAEGGQLPAGIVTQEQQRSREAATRTSKPLTSALRARTMEKIEEVLKEVARSKDGKSISFRLDPPSLGSMRAEVSMRDGVLHARLWAESSQVTSLLREKAHELHAALRKLGLPVDQVAVSVSSQESEFSTSGGPAQGDSGSQGKTERRQEKNALVDLPGSGILGEAREKSMVEDHWVA